MKKFIYLILIAVVSIAAVSCSSCTNDNEPFGIQYSLTSTGMVNGSLEMGIFTGEVGLKGDADYHLSFASDTTKFEGATFCGPLNGELLRSDAETLKAAEEVNNWLKSAFVIKDYEGHYDIYIKGYVMETKTHLKFEIDEHWTDTPTE